MCQNLSPIGLLVYKLVILVKLLLQIFKTMEKSDFRVLIKHCFLMGWGDTVWVKQWLDKCYLDSAPFETMVKRWYADFKCGRTDANEAECSDCPNLAVVPENIKKIDKLILAVAWDSRGIEDIRRQCIHQFAWTFFKRKLCSKWMQHLLSRSKTTMHWWFSVLFATVSMQRKGVFV